VLTRLLRSSREAVVPVAADVMNRIVGTATEATPLGVLIDLLAEGGQQAVPVLEEGKLIGLVSRSDLIAALARAHHPDPAHSTGLHHV
jgi:CBS domain-containing membrane protein